MLQSKFNIGDIVLAFNSIEWSKIGDLSETNHEFQQKATVLKVRKVSSDIWVADLRFESGLKSNGHFQNTLKYYF